MFNIFLPEKKLTFLSEIFVRILLFACQLLAWVETLFHFYTWLKAIAPSRHTAGNLPQDYSIQIDGNKSQ